MLVARGLRKAYGQHEAVKSFDVDVRPGVIVGLVGNNGAGKTTVLKMLCGLLEPTSGHVEVDGRSTLQPEARRRVGFVPEDSPLYEELTPLQLLDFFARLYGLPRATRRERVPDVLRRMRLDVEHWAKPCGTLSKGSARKVALARALLHDPQVLILDEPSSGLDPATRSELEAVLQSERARGVGILLSAHDMPQVERLCDEVLIMHKGRVAARGTLAGLQEGLAPTVYRVVAEVAFHGSVPRGARHEATVADTEALWETLAAARSAGAQAVEAHPVRPGLREILARLDSQQGNDAATEPA